jgi:hypothetical protein
MKHKDVTPTTKVYKNEILSSSNFKVWLRANHCVKFKKIELSVLCGWSCLGEASRGCKRAERIN